MVSSLSGEVVKELEAMHWQFIAVAGSVVSVALFLVVLFLTQKVLRFRSDRARTRSITETGCRG